MSFLEDIVKRQQALQLKYSSQNQNTVRVLKKKVQSNQRPKTVVVGVHLPKELHKMMKDVLKDRGNELGVDSLRKLALLCIKEHLERLDSKPQVA